MSGLSLMWPFTTGMSYLEAFCFLAVMLLGEFHKIYIFSTLGDKDGLIGF